MIWLMRLTIGDSFIVEVNERRRIQFGFQKRSQCRSGEERVTQMVKNDLVSASLMRCRIGGSEQRKAGKENRSHIRDRFIRLLAKIVGQSKLL